jgi:hypothetical protein
MDNYRVAPTGNGFQVVEELPDGRKSFMDGFPTEDDARGWLNSFLILLGLIDRMSGRTFRRTW